jgi:SAM-dependent methyltransferase
MTLHSLSSSRRWLSTWPIHELPFPEPFSFFLPNAVARFRDHLRLAGKNVLLVGYSEAQALALVEQEKIGSAKRLALWADHVDALGSAFPVIIGDICKRAEFADNTFDAVLFLSVWEHVRSIDEACREAARITKDGGIVFTEFGPVWSGPTGHHIYHDPASPALDFTMRQLPTHMHLLYDRETVIRYLTEHRGIHERSAREATDLVFVSDNINRLPADAYFAAARHYFRPLVQEHYSSPVSPQVLDLLWKRGGFDLTYAGFEGGAWALVVDKNL